MRGGQFTVRASDDIAMLALNKALAGTTLELAAIAGNIANLETPGYRTRHISFAAQLQGALAAPERAQAAAIGQVEPVAVVDQTPPVRADGNNVQIDQELTRLAKTSLHHRVLTRLLAKKIHMLEEAISGGASR